MICQGAIDFTVCTNLRGVHIVTWAGHSIPEEQPEQVNKLLLGFLREVTAT
jgi:pimeloyl-ACP methyl ester carboxylesterase